MKFKQPFATKAGNGAAVAVASEASTPAAPVAKPADKAFDYYDFDSLLRPEERDVRDKVRAFTDAEIVPVIAEYWEKDETPMFLLDKLAALNICGGSIEGYGCPGFSPLLTGLIQFELTRGDGSVGTLFGVTSGLGMMSIYLCGSEAQKQQWLPRLARMEAFCSFGLTEPFIGSDASHIQTTAKKVGDTYVLNGAKRWIGGATFADVTVVWAQDDQTGQVSGFLVEKDTPGFTPTKIKGKLALRALPNADIKFENCVIPASNRLTQANSFRDTAAVLRATRLGVAWAAVGHAQAAYEFALTYAKKRQQFGRPIAGFQLIQEKLVNMLAELEYMKITTAHLSRLSESGKMTDGQASLAKLNNARKARQIVAQAREILGGNGILLEQHVIRHFADMEAVYSYEGTNEINTLVVGREITGLQAFA
jgi:glutaryl-CoA dehydrogenase